MLGRSGRRPVVLKGWPMYWSGQDGELSGPVAKNLSDARAGWTARGIRCPVLGTQCSLPQANVQRRRHSWERHGWRSASGMSLIDTSQWAFLWVVDAPMFESGRHGGWTAVHHPFTSPHESWLAGFRRRPRSALAYAYDLVLNGSEIGGGSIRIHQVDVQRRVFDVIGLTPKAMPMPSSASCWRRSSTDRHPMAGLPLAWIGWLRCLARPSRSARSLPSPRRHRVATR